MRGHILVVNQYFPPDVASTGLLAAEISAAVAAQGVQVTVVAGQPSYTSDATEAPAVETQGNVCIRRLSLGSARGRERMPTRLEGYARFLWEARRVCDGLARSTRLDAVVTFHNPPLVGLIGARLAAAYHLPYTYVLFDIHPDVLKAAGWPRLPWPVLTGWDSLHRRVLSAAGAIVVHGESMRTVLIRDKGIAADKVHAVPMWGHPELTPAPRVKQIRDSLGIDDDVLLLVFAGNVGIMHPVDAILDAAVRLRGAPVRFALVGGGVRRQALVARVAAQRLDNVTVLSYLPEQEFRRLIQSADACVVTLMSGLERLAVPSRAFAFLSAGKPVLAVMPGESDIGRLCLEGCGWVVRDGGQLEDAVRHLLANRDELERRGRTAVEIYQERFRKDRGLEQYVNVILSNSRAPCGRAA